MKQLKYYIAAIIAFAIWGTFSFVLKPLHQYSSLDILFYRVFSCAIIMSFISVLFKKGSIKENLHIFKNQPQKVRQKTAVLNILSSTLLTANWFSFIYVMNHISVRATSVAYLVCPILTTILAFFILHDKLNRLQWLSVILSGAGCILLSYSNLIDMLYSSLVGLTYAVYLVIQNINKKFDKFLVLNIHIVFASLILLPFFPAYSNAVPAEFKFYAFIEVIAVLYTIVPLLLNLYALSGISSSKVGMILNINPIIAFILAATVFHEKLEFIQILAYSIIFLAVIIFNSKEIFATRLKPEKMKKI
ncbi:EamA family transporter [Chryseobacterium sp. SN22]|uniref:EamA family transporter n=1 Tax=Chryseobacterium sp. SN22 TaxID=2606431 RepID=UPI0011EFB980|nr:EamA family transporter [Chryseobacterium sp. SN22]KAA0128402.1 EamA family transporter [Chryseobacterium sp. SN22]